MATDTRQDECCTLEASPLDIRVCPACGNTGKSVSKLTVAVMAKDPKIYLHAERLPDGKYFICETKSCPTVYFSTQNGTLVGKDGVRVRVWQKEDDPEVPACYCFRNSTASIQNELKRTGSTEVLSRISAEVKAGNCRCEVTNPQGSCCLGNVAKAIKIARKNLALN